MSGDYWNTEGKVTHVWRCSVPGCAAVKHEEDSFLRGQERKRMPDFPKDWSSVNGLLICDKHVIEVDGIRN